MPSPTRPEALACPVTKSCSAVYEKEALQCRVLDTDRCSAYLAAALSAAFSAAPINFFTCRERQ